MGQRRVGRHAIDARAGNTFAKVLRAFLRQDPDVMMIGGYTTVDEVLRYT